MFPLLYAVVSIFCSLLHAFWPTPRKFSWFLPLFLVFSLKVGPSFQGYWWSLVLRSLKCFSTVLQALDSESSDRLFHREIVIPILEQYWLVFGILQAIWTI